MKKQRKLWRFASVDNNTVDYLSSQLELPKIITQLLLNRGVLDELSAQEYLYGSFRNLEDPFLMKNMDRAVSRIIQAVDAQQTITVYGDYDVDGITATALVYSVLAELGAKVNYYVPDRQKEGYGLNVSALKRLCDLGTELIVTVDCGISAYEEIKYINHCCDVIISDHHQPPELLPDAYAVVNPQQKDCEYPYKKLAGVGVAYKLCQAVWQRCKGGNATDLHRYLDMVAIGTIADIVPLTGENRILVKEGLKEIACTKNTGLQSLLNVCGLIDCDIDTGKIGYVVAPRLNAAGRLGEATIGIELLVTQDISRANEIALYLDQENAQRQKIEQEIYAQAEEMITKINLEETKVLVLAGNEWHAGVIGIVASRLVEKYYRPVIIVSLQEGVGKGSCRSIPGFDIYSALTECADILDKFGGHPMAAGITILQGNISELCIRLNELALRSLKEEDYFPVLHVDASIALHEINAVLLEQLASLAPFGVGNPKPVFACEKLRLKSIHQVGQGGRHLKLAVSQDNTTFNVISWEMGHIADQLGPYSKVDMAFIPEFNEWNGRKTIQLKAHDVRPILASDNSNSRAVSIQRVVVGQVYLILKKLMHSGKMQTTISNAELADLVFEKYQTAISEQGVEVAISVLAELQLVKTYKNQNARILLMQPPPAHKLDIETSVTFCSGILVGEIKGAPNIKNFI